MAFNKKDYQKNYWKKRWRKHRNEEQERNHHKYIKRKGDLEAEQMLKELSGACLNEI